jgi:hypothetical protein
MVNSDSLWIISPTRRSAGRRAGCSLSASSDRLYLTTVIVYVTTGVNKIAAMASDTDDLNRFILIMVTQLVLAVITLVVTSLKYVRRCKLHCCGASGIDLDVYNVTPRPSPRPAVADV